MIKSQITELLQTKYDFNHIIADSIAKNFKQEIKIEEDIDSVVAKFNNDKPKPFIKWVGGKGTY